METPKISSLVFCHRIHSIGKPASTPADSSLLDLLPSLMSAALGASEELKLQSTLGRVGSAHLSLTVYNTQAALTHLKNKMSDAS